MDNVSEEVCNNSTQWIVTRARVFSRRKFGIRETPHNKIRIRKRRLVLGFCDFGRTKPNSLIFSIGAGLVRAKFNVVGLANDVAIGSLLPSKSARAEFLVAQMAYLPPADRLAP